MEQKKTKNHPDLLPATFRQYLQEELVKRCRKNRGYSLRAFANALAVPHSSLSRILRAERPVSAQMQKHLSERLNVGPIELAHFESIPMKKVKKEYRKMELDQFSVIADWYHSAILELIAVKGFRSDARWIAKRLGITVSEANTAIERLLNLEMLKRKKSGKLVNAVGSQTTLTKTPHTSQAQRRLQKQVLEMALSALEEIPVEKRSQTSVTMAINKKRLPEALEYIRRFRRDLSQFLEQDLDKDEVYHLGISLYPVTRTQSTGEKNEIN